MTFIVVGTVTGRACAVQQQEPQPGGGPPLHRHSREDKGFSVLAGEYEFRVGEQTFLAPPGTLVFGLRGIPHAFDCLDPNPGKIQVIISPPRLEAFFEELDALAKEGTPDMGQNVALAGKYGLETSAPAGVARTSQSPGTRLAGKPRHRRLGSTFALALFVDVTGEDWRSCGAPGGVADRSVQALYWVD
jgi:quercetin dioxygenase-like cupin family protein